MGLWHGYLELGDNGYMHIRKYLKGAWEQAKSFGDLRSRESLYEDTFYGDGSCS